MPTISLCMIVKNEEKHLARCLDSVAELVEEIVIVDTGSTDRTVEIASCYTSRVYSTPGRMIFQMPETSLFPERPWTTACGWMRMMFWKKRKRVNFWN